MIRRSLGSKRLSKKLLRTDPGPHGPASSVRLENLRDGMEDYSLFHRLGADRSAKLISRVVANGPHCSPGAAWNNVSSRCVDWREEPLVLEQARRQAAAMLVRELREGRGL